MNKCTCTYCKTCRGTGLVEDDNGFMWPPDEEECPVCCGDGLIDYCDYCRENDEKNNQRESWFEY